jgi:hypothetical protein
VSIFNFQKNLQLKWKRPNLRRKHQRRRKIPLQKTPQQRKIHLLRMIY